MKVYLGADDNLPLSFGKHKGMTPIQIAEIEPSYVVWLYESTDHGIVTKTLYEACQQDAREDESARAEDTDEERLEPVDKFMKRH